MAATEHDPPPAPPQAIIAGGGGGGLARGSGYGSGGIEAIDSDTGEGAGVGRVRVSLQDEGGGR